MRGNRVLAFVVAVASLGALASAVSASPAQPPSPGSFRIDTVSASWPPDPAFAFGLGWQLQQATCARLLNYPDAPHPDGSRLIPEIAAAMPTISSDGRTYTFQVRNDFAFSPPASGVVTAQSMKWTFERIAHPTLSTPGYRYMTNIVGAEEFHEGQANEITGIDADGDMLTIALIEPQGHFASIVALPFFCAVPTSMPPVEQFAPIPSAGPYYISAFTVNQRLTALPNPNYDGPRPQRFDSFEYYFAQNEDDIRQRVESGVTDYTSELGFAHWDELRQLYGPDSAAAARGLQQWFPTTQPCLGYLALNTERPTFASVNMRKAVNYAIDRSDLSATLPLGGAPITDQYLPAGIPGYSDIDVYPSEPNIELARDLAGWHPGDLRRPITVYYRSSGAANLAQYEEVKSNLEEIGFDVTGVGLTGGLIYTRIGTRGEPFDVAVSIGWCEEWHDPWSYIQLLDGTTIHDGPGNLNFSYFNDPVFNARMHAAAQLFGEQRYAAFEQIEHDLVRDAAPWAAWRLYGTGDFFSKRVGCQVHHPSYGMNLAALCVRPEISTDDASGIEPAIGTATLPITVRLSSEMESSVSIAYATQDGTAHAGEDYVATSGNLTFTPNQRVKTVDVTVNEDLIREPAETFTLNLSNESAGTIVDAQAVATILDQPLGPPPPGPPPPPQPPPPVPPPPPPPPPAPCRVPRVTGMTLARAKTRIRRNHCSLGRVRRVRSRRSLRGRVVSQTPRPGVLRPRGFRVNLRVGRR